MGGILAMAAHLEENARSWDAHAQAYERMARDEGSSTAGAELRSSARAWRQNAIGRRADADRLLAALRDE